MKENLEKFYQDMKFITVLLIVEAIAFFICKFCIWLEVLFHPYTHFGLLAMTIWQHLVAIFIGFFTTFEILNNGGRKK